MPAVEALPFRITDTRQGAATQHGFAAFDFLDQFRPRHSERYVHASPLLARWAEKPGGRHPPSRLHCQDEIVCQGSVALIPSAFLSGWQVSFVGKMIDAGRS
jgi:hypothetical protein